MKYEIRKEDIVVGFTALEGSDPPMGFVFGPIEPTEFYTPDFDGSGCSLYVIETGQEISSESITIEDYSKEMGEQCVEVTVVIGSAEEYEKFFKHHLEAYEKQFS
ncbi:hypothetical protein [Microbulbifer variabilis]|uniref:hypothetical protein n=1 Tax=Microbulbifer variabilis TaxID=266805 RepID=UPI000363C747|nr:hypothetical protein [Microbulbifer variabilis]